MFTVKRPMSLLWYFPVVWAICEGMGYALKTWVFPWLSWVLSTIPWQGGWALTILSYVVWLYAGIAWVLCWILMNAYWYLGAGIAAFAALRLLDDFLGAKYNAFKRIIVYHARNLAKSYDPSTKCLGEVQTSAFLNVVNAALLSGISPKQVKAWSTEGFGQGYKDASLLDLVNLWIGYDEFSFVPTMQISPAIPQPAR